MMLFGVLALEGDSQCPKIRQAEAAPSIEALWPEAKTMRFAARPKKNVSKDEVRETVKSEGNSRAKVERKLEEK